MLWLNFRGWPCLPSIGLESLRLGQAEGEDGTDDAAGWKRKCLLKFKVRQKWVLAAAGSTFGSQLPSKISGPAGLQGRNHRDLPFRAWSKQGCRASLTSVVHHHVCRNQASRVPGSST